MEWTWDHQTMWAILHQKNSGFVTLFPSRNVFSSIEFFMSPASMEGLHGLQKHDYIDDVGQMHHRYTQKPWLLITRESLQSPGHLQQSTAKLSIIPRHQQKQIHWILQRLNKNKGKLQDPKSFFLTYNKGILYFLVFHMVKKLEMKTTYQVFWKLLPDSSLMLQ